MTLRWRLTLLGVVALLVSALGVLVAQLPSIGAGGLLHPSRRRVVGPLPAGCEEATFAGDGVALQGWRCAASTSRRGALVYLHGVADNRTSGAGIVDRYRRRGFDVVAYDSRAHGESAGVACTFGFFEKHDLHHVVDTLPPGPIVLLGTSLGAAVALQEMASDTRVTAAVAAETFSDLHTVAAERAPVLFTPGIIARAFRIAEQQGNFEVDAVSPLAAAAAITQPVLLIHGDADVDTPPDHSRRVLAALAGPKRLILVPGAGHNQSLRGDVWVEIDQWLDAVLADGRRGRDPARATGAPSARGSGGTDRVGR